MTHPVDVWYGIGMGHGESLLIPGTLMDNGKTIRITHKPWLDNFGWNKPYYDYPARKLPDTYKVRYDDYCYSEIGEVPKKLLVPGSVIYTKRLYPWRIHLSDEECLVLDIMEN